MSCNVTLARHHANPPRAHYAIKMVTSRRVTRVGGIFTFTMGSGTISQTNMGIVMNCNDSKKNINLDSFGEGF